MTTSQHSAGPQAPARKRRRWPWILGGLVLLIVLIAALSGGGDSTPAPSGGSAAQSAAPQQPTAGDLITYEVSGSGTASNITYITDRNASQSQVASAPMPWKKDVTFADGGAFSITPLSLVAQNGQDGGEITCRISKNGQQVTMSTSSGPFAVVTCSGT